jgi:hypothetical protein
MQELNQFGKANMRTFEPFSKGQLDDVLRSQLEQINAKIYSEVEDYLLNVKEEDYIDHLVSEFTIDIPKIDFDTMTVSPTERIIPANRHPSSLFFIDDTDKSFRRQVIIFHFPFSGDINVLDFVPNPHILWTQQFTYNDSTEDGEITFEIINFANDAETIKRESGQVVGNLKTQLGHIANQLNGYNSNLRQEITQRVQDRKKDLAKKSDFLSQLGVPVKKKDNLPETFSIPTPKIPKKIIPRPPATTTNPNPDPTLDISTYNEILDVVHDLGKTIERMPATYQGKTEEQLRDHFLMYLEPRFEGSATGETFNRSGKTDILMRYENSNAFVAECKYWGGEKLYLETIDQILKYLTWRDSKAAIIMFVKNADFSSVIQKVKEETPTHANYLSFDGEKEETRLSYKVSLNGDRERKIYLTVLLFHYPET